MLRANPSLANLTHTIETEERQEPRGQGQHDGHRVQVYGVCVHTRGGVPQSMCVIVGLENGTIIQNVLQGIQIV